MNRIPKLAAVLLIALATLIGVAGTANAGEVYRPAVACSTHGTPGFYYSILDGPDWDYPSGNGSQQAVNQSWYPGGICIISYSGKTKFSFQTDGNATLVHTNSDGTRTMLWQSHTTATQGNSTKKLSLMQNGQMIVFNTAGTPMWASHTQLSPAPASPLCQYSDVEGSVWCGTALTIDDTGVQLVNHATGYVLWDDTHGSHV